MRFKSFAILYLLSLGSLACIWDTDTLRDELQTKAAVFDLITGQFPHHSKAYYQARIQKNLAELGKEPDNLDVRNDLAVGYLKTARYKLALAEFEKLDKQKPGEYRTLSNLGVLHKKMKEYKKAAEYTKKALEIKPEGHLGLADYYLKMLDHMTREASGDNSETNFLGQKYGEWGSMYSTPVEKLDYPRLEALIRADRTYADGMLVMAEQLNAQMDLNLALWAYVRAQELGHPQKELIDKRINWIFSHWRAAVKNGSNRWGKSVPKKKETIAEIKAGLKKAAAWLEQFEKVEEGLVAKGKSVDFKAVEQELERQGIKRYRPGKIGIKSGFLPFLQSRDGIIVIGMIFLPILMVMLMRRFRAARK